MVRGEEVWERNSVSYQQTLISYGNCDALFVTVIFNFNSVF